jgi:ferredoxin/flavodoxin---NADP+ reductase
MKPAHFIAVFGGAVAGSEAAAELVKRNIHVVVFEQNALPYGKLETGLPKWHDKLRDRQEAVIDEKLTLPLISFVPLTRLGRDLDFQELRKDWPFSAILLAIGAWRDRPLGIAGIERFIDMGLIYQNPLVHWFNYNHDPKYQRAQLEIPDGTLIIGGGLASLDVAKIAVIETVRTALAARGIKADALTLERKGVVDVLRENGLSMDALGLQGCTMVTRGGIGDMPLNVIADDASPEEIAKAVQTRQKILAKLVEKFPFKIVERRQPVDFIEKDGRLTGLVLAPMRSEGSHFLRAEGPEEKIYAPLVISAIGSIPEQIPGIPMVGEIYDVEDLNTGKIRGCDKVFALGNAVTGRGNIRQSQLHSRQVSETIVDQYLAWQPEDYQEIFSGAEQRVDLRVSSIFEQITRQEPIPAEAMDWIYERIKELQARAGYLSDYQRWIKEHMPSRL